MCGIVGYLGPKQAYPILIDGLKRLEYRGYDSAGIATLEDKATLRIEKKQGKVANLEVHVGNEKPKGTVGIGHTRWATHGPPNDINAHPHAGGQGHLAVIHNGIIENYVELKEKLIKQGYQFKSQTDSELIAHQLDFLLCKGNEMLEAMFLLKEKLDGAYAVAAIDLKNEAYFYLMRNKSPLILGQSDEGMFAASDPLALADLTNEFIFLEDGDVAEVSAKEYKILDKNQKRAIRKITNIDVSSEAMGKNGYRHFMEKEIYEQPTAILNTLDGRIGGEDVLENIFGEGSSEFLSKAERIQIVAAGTSLHAGRVAANWFSAIANLPSQIDFASEYRYKNPYVDKNTLLLTISQSGETADTLGALRYAKERDYLGSLTICNVPTSSIARESDYVLLTNAGPEIGVASTKAFTTQLTALMLLTLSLAKARNLNPRLRGRMVGALRALPEIISESLKLKSKIIKIAKEIAKKDNALFLGRGIFYPIAQEGSLKLKEISYIHAEAYPAGELKHGPLALIDKNMPVVALAPENELAEKLISNLEEVKARGGKLFVVGNAAGNMKLKPKNLIDLPECDFLLTPILYTVPLQILSYEVALLRGTDIDQPRNLAKSVTVE